MTHLSNLISSQIAELKSSVFSQMDELRAETRKRSRSSTRRSSRPPPNTNGTGRDRDRDGGEDPVQESPNGREELFEFERGGDDETTDGGESDTPRPRRIRQRRGQDCQARIGRDLSGS